MKTTMKLFAVLLGAVAAWGQQVTISDNLPNAVGGGGVLRGGHLVNPRYTAAKVAFGATGKLR